MYLHLSQRFIYKIRDPSVFPHATIINFLTFMQQIYAEVDSRIIKLQNKLKSPRIRDKIYSEIDDKMIKYLSNYEVNY
jgi:hypothetical protein